jgi:hypothetical protein
MFGKVKRWLGIEGVKVELHVPDKVRSADGLVEGKVRFYSMHDQVVKSLRVKLIEKYKRGRRGNKLVDEYTLGEIFMERNIAVPAHQYIEVEFKLPFTPMPSDMDKLEASNFMMKGIVRSAKLMKGVSSVFRVEAEADVQGTALNPFDTKELAIA